MTFEEWWMENGDDNADGMEASHRACWDAASKLTLEVDRLRFRVNGLEARLRRLEGEHAIHYPQPGPLAR